MSNNNQDYFTIEPYVFITKKICTIYNITVGQFRIVSKKVIEHKIKKHKIYNNDADITDNYLNNIYLIAKNIKK